MLSGNNGYQLPWETLTCEETIWTYLNQNCHEGDVTSPDSKEILLDWLTGISKDAKGGLNTSEQSTATENAWTIFPKRTCTEQMWSTVALIKTNYCINHFIHFLQFPFFLQIVGKVPNYTMMAKGLGQATEFHFLGLFERFHRHTWHIFPITGHLGRARRVGNHVLRWKLRMGNMPSANLGVPYWSKVFWLLEINIKTTSLSL